MPSARLVWEISRLSQIARRAGRRPSPGVTAGASGRPPAPAPAWPQGLGHGRAVLLFAAFAWIEIVWPKSDSPALLAQVIIAYSVITWTAMALFGRRWLEHGEAFSVAFAVFARFAPLAPVQAAGATGLAPYLPESLGRVVLAAALVIPRSLSVSGFGRFSSRRYLLSRTRWRSIRFGMTGSRRRHGLLMLGLTLVVGLTLGLAIPMMRNKLAQHLVENTWLGDRKFGYQGQNLDLYKKILLPYLAAFGILIGFMGAFGLAAAIFDEAAAGNWDAATRQGVGKVGGVVALVFLGLWWVSMGLIYMAVEYRFIAESTSLGGVRFKLGYTIWGFLRFNIVNLLLMTLTFSLAFPWVVGRIVRFTAHHLSMEGDLDLESIGQHPHGPPGTGEGLAEAVDVGGL